MNNNEALTLKVKNNYLLNTILITFRHQIEVANDCFSAVNALKHKQGCTTQSWDKVLNPGDSLALFRAGLGIVGAAVKLPL